MRIELHRCPFAAPARTGPRRLAWGLVLGLLLTSAAQAQSLYEVYEAARGFDATYLGARALADSAQYRAAVVHGLRRPTLSASLGASHTTNDIPNSDSTQKSTTAGLSATQTLFNRANDMTISQADQSVEIAKADLDAAEQELIVRVAQDYFDVLAAQDALETAQANKRAIAEQLASAKRNFEVGTATITDTREAQARFDLATALEIAADNDLRSKRVVLDTLVGRNDVTPKPLATPLDMAPVLPGTVNDWIVPIEDSPAVRRARLGFEIAKLETAKARAGHLPTVDLAASYGKGHVASDGSQLVGGSVGPFDTAGPATSSSIGVTLRLPLFAGYQIQNRVKETISLEEQARNTLEAARRTVAQDTRRSYFGVESGQAQVKALEAAESSTQLALEATQLGYKVGVRVNLDVLNAQTQLFTTRRDLAKARYDVLVGSLKLRQAAGTLKPDDVLTVNQLLSK